MSVKNGVVTIENRNLFIDTKGYIFNVTLEKEGKILGREEHTLNISAGEIGTFEIGMKTPEECGEYVFTVSAVLAENTLWAESGHEISFAQEIIRNAEEKEITNAKAEIIYGDFCIGVHEKASQYSLTSVRAVSALSSMTVRNISQERRKSAFSEQ